MLPLSLRPYSNSFSLPGCFGTVGFLPFSPPLFSVVLSDDLGLELLAMASVCAPSCDGVVDGCDVQATTTVASVSCRLLVSSVRSLGVWLAVIVTVSSPTASSELLPKVLAVALRPRLQKLFQLPFQ